MNTRTFRSTLDALAARLGIEHFMFTTDNVTWFSGDDPEYPTANGPFLWVGTLSGPDNNGDEVAASVWEDSTGLWFLDCDPEILAV
jgi:hypothetical protein